MMECTSPKNKRNGNWKSARRTLLENKIIALCAELSELDASLNGDKLFQGSIKQYEASNRRAALRYSIEIRESMIQLGVSKIAAFMHAIMASFYNWIGK